jgi:S-formylglutathione hydrolase FrmB
MMVMESNSSSSFLDLKRKLNQQPNPMKKLLLNIILFFPTLLTAQHAGKVLEGKTIKSTILGKDVRYSIYLPADYETSGRKYPIVYLLHGYSDNETAWVQFGSVNRAADQLTQQGEINPMIIAMPDGGVSWYINDSEGKVKYMDFFRKEFIPAIEKEYKVIGKAEYRAIAGLSMGGYGSLIHSLQFPAMFSACTALSAAIWSDGEIKALPKERYSRYFTKIYGANPDSEGDSRLTKHWKEHSVIELVKTLPIDSLKKVRLYIDCGDDDFLTVGNMSLHIALKERDIKHEFRMRDGYHNWDYWRTSIYDALRFIAKGFDRR